MMLSTSYSVLSTVLMLLSAEWISNLPHFNAFLNFTSFILLLSGYYFIRKKNVIAHRNCQIAALSVSVLFLISYLTYHFNHGTTRFQGQGIVRPIYFTILMTHTVLAAVIVPFVIVTVLRAKRRNFLRHKAIARWTLPMWLYVSVTGVLVYLMLYQFYPSR